MAQLTLEALKSRLPTSDWDKTEHVLASITPSAVQVHYLEHSPIWGFRRIKTCTETRNWQAELDATVTGFGNPNATTEFVANGEIVEGARKIRAAVLEDFLKSAFSSTPLPANAALLPFGDAAAQEWYHVLASALGVQRGFTLSPDAALFPSEPELESMFRAQSLVFPWDVLIAVADLKRGDLVVGSKTMPTRGIAPRADGTFRAMASLYLAPGATSAELYLMRSLAGRQEAFDPLEVRPPANPFTLCISFAPGSEKPTCAVSRVAPLRLTKSAPPLGSPLALGDDAGKPTDLAFLIDGSMTQPEFESARAFIQGITDRLARSSPALRLAYVLYAEYQHKTGYTWEAPWEYEYRAGDFMSQAAFDRYLAAAHEAGVKDDDPCDALELGLKAARTKLKWNSEVRLLVIVGNSPPHPTAGERAEYGLLDRETEQHQGIRWEDEFTSLIMHCKVQPFAVWLEPARPKSPGEQLPTSDRRWRKYADEVWLALGRKRQPAALSAGGQEAVLAFIRAARGASFSLDRTATLPLVRPLIASIKP